MTQRGRKSAASLSVVPTDMDDDEHSVHPSQRKLLPPVALTAQEQEIWDGTIASKGSDYFGPEHIPLLTEYVRAVRKSATIDAELKNFNFAERDMREYTAMNNAAMALARAIAMLATKLRLTHQSALRKSNVENPWGRGKKIWQRNDQS